MLPDSSWLLNQLMLLRPSELYIQIQHCVTFPYEQWASCYPSILDAGAACFVHHICFMNGEFFWLEIHVTCPGTDHHTQHLSSPICPSKKSQIISEIKWVYLVSTCAAYQKNITVHICYYQNNLVLLTDVGHLKKKHF